MFQGDTQKRLEKREKEQNGPTQECSLKSSVFISTDYSSSTLKYCFLYEYQKSLMRAPLEELERLERKSSFTKEGDLVQERVEHLHLMTFI